MSNPASNRAYQAAQAAQVNARVTADTADQRAYLNRLAESQKAADKARMDAEYKRAQEARWNQSRDRDAKAAEARLAKEKDMAKTWEQRKADEAKAEKAEKKNISKMMKADAKTARKQALANMLKKFTGKGRPMGLPGGDLKNLRR